MLEPEVIFETKNFLAVNKPAGLVVHAAKVREKARSKKRDAKTIREEQEPTLVDWLLAHRPEVAIVGDDPAVRPGIVHRLDKETSGVMLVAKTQAYFEYLKSLFQEHRIIKTYAAVVRGVPKNKTGVIDAPIGIVNGTLKRSVRSKKMQKEAVTEYRVLKIFVPEGETERGEEKFALLEINPKTGRTHQIRVHLASIGYPIAGDKLYGSKAKTDRAQFPRLMLHAAGIEFPEKDGSILRIQSEPGSLWQDVLRALNP